MIPNNVRVIIHNFKISYFKKKNLYNYSNRILDGIKKGKQG